MSRRVPIPARLFRYVHRARVEQVNDTLRAILLVLNGEHGARVKSSTDEQRAALEAAIDVVQQFSERGDLPRPGEGRTTTRRVRQ